MEMQQKIAVLADSFSDCSCILAAMGDEPRQHLILEMLRMGRCSGLRVCEITEKANLSRPAVSHQRCARKEPKTTTISTRRWSPLKN